MALRRILLAVAGAAAFFVSAPAFAQVDSAIIAPTYKTPGGNTGVATGTFCIDPDTGTKCTGGGGGGGGGGDASAANQSTQITAANLSNTRLGDITSPATGSVNARLEQVRALLAGSLTVTLPTGASTSAAQATGNASLSSIDTKVGQGRDTGGRLVPGQGIATSTRTALAASTATSISAAAAARIGLTVQVEAALTANLFLCTTQTASCSATSYDAMIPSGAGAGTTYTFLFAPNTALYAFTTGTPTVVANSWVAQ